MRHSSKVLSMEGPWAVCGGGGGDAVQQQGVVNRRDWAGREWDRGGGGPTPTAPPTWSMTLHPEHQTLAPPSPLPPDPIT